MQKKNGKVEKQAVKPALKIKLSKLWGYFYHMKDAWVLAEVGQGRTWKDMSKADILRLVSKLDGYLTNDVDDDFSMYQRLTAKAWFGAVMSEEELEFLLVNNIFEVIHEDFGDFVNGRDFKYTVVINLNGLYYVFVYYKDFFTQDRVFVPQKLVRVDRHVTTCVKKKITYTVL